MSILTKTQSLRDEAWTELMASPPYEVFKALDDAVVALGGRTAMPMLSSVKTVSDRVIEGAIRRLRDDKVRRMTQATGATTALVDAGEPLPIGRLLEKTLEKGVVIGGNNPLANFRSTLSKDPRFRAINRNNMYFWWFADRPTPTRWNEAPDLLERETGATQELTNEKGGGTNATAA